MRRTRLVASVVGRSVDAVTRTVEHGTDGADVVEVRIDGLANAGEADLRQLRDASDRPVILTCRSRAEGGSFEGSESERLSLLERGVRAGFDYIDVEIAALEKAFPKGNAHLILSHHDFDGLPRDPGALVEKALEMGADVVKLAARVSSLDEAWTLASMGDAVRKAGKEFVPVAMGPAGVAARILSARFGAAFTYAAARGGAPTGPGQVTLDEMVNLYRFASIGSETEIYGILGTHAHSSRSPAMHNPFFESIAKNAVYVPFEENDLEAFVRGAKRLGVSGLSVTLPFKESILPFLDTIDDAAARIGAVNTVVVREHRWKGYNTDVEGVVEPLARRGEWKGRSAVVVGSGGAARAAVFALERLGASVRVVARRKDKAASLAKEVGGASGVLSELRTASWDLLVNATPIGSDDATPQTLPLATIESEQCVLDMVTSPEITPLIRRARDAGARTITGIEMLGAQAGHQAELWTGVRPQPLELEQSARAHLTPTISKRATS